MTLENTPARAIESIVAAQRRFFATGSTLSLDYRKDALRRLKKALLGNEKAIAAAHTTAATIRKILKNHLVAMLLNFISSCNFLPPFTI